MQSLVSTHSYGMVSCLPTSIVGYYNPAAQRWEYSTKFAVYGTRFLIRDKGASPNKTIRAEPASTSVIILRGTILIFSSNFNRCSSFCPCDGDWSRSSHLARDGDCTRSTSRVIHHPPQSSVLSSWVDKGNLLISRHCIQSMASDVSRSFHT